MQFRLSIIAALFVALLASATAFVPVARAGVSTRVYLDDWTKLGDMDKQMTEKLRAQIADIQNVALAKVEEKYSELRAKLSEGSAGIIPEKDMDKMREAARVKARAQLGIED